MGSEAARGVRYAPPVRARAAPGAWADENSASDDEDGAGGLTFHFGQLAQQWGTWDSASLRARARASFAEGKTQFRAWTHHVWRDTLYNVRETRKRLGPYLLGFFSCFFVVMISATVGTLIAKSPVFFMRLAEISEGEQDVVLYAGSWTGADRLNYTAVDEIVQPFTQFRQSTPRRRFTTLVFNADDCTGLDGIDPATPDWKYVGVDETWACRNQTVTTSTNCVSDACGEPLTMELYLTDSKREADIGMGREWPYADEGGIVLNGEIADLLRVGVGDTIHLMYSSRMTDVPVDPAVRAVFITVRVDGVYTSSEAAGKFASDVFDFIGVMEYASFWPRTLANTNPAMPPDVHEALAREDLFHYADEVVFNMPNRMSVYTNTAYEDVRAGVLDFSATLSYVVGFDEVDSDFPILDALFETRFFALFLTLILNIVLLIATILSVVLISALLTVNVETRTFETGILRMIGMDRFSVVQLVTVQALLYAVPAWALGLVAAQGMSAIVLTQFGALVNVSVDKTLAADPIGWATALGLIIPLAAAVFPVRKALRQSLMDALDVKHSRVKAVKYSVHRADDAVFPVGEALIGAMLAVFGFLIYYLFPLSLLTFNITLLLYIFFGLLMGMLMGLVLLAMNVQHLLEKAVVVLFLWWENPAISTLVKKNLNAHRARNRKTTLMYSLSVGFIIFISVSARLQLITQAYSIQQQNGVRFKVTTRNRNGIRNPAELEQYAREHAHLIESTSWVSFDLEEVVPDSTTRITNLGHAYNYDNQIFAVSPNLYETTLGGFLHVRSSSTRSEYAIDEQLYTVRGSQQAVVGSMYRVGLDLGMDDRFLFEVGVTEANSTFTDLLSGGQSDETAVFSDGRLAPMRPLAMLDGSPAFRFSQYPSQEFQDALVSFPTFVRLANGAITSVQEVPLQHFLIRFRGGITGDEIDQVSGDLSSMYEQDDDEEVWDYRDEEESLDTAVAVLGYIFGFITFVAMFFCFFSLMTSMFTNVYEQAKEIGVLRAIGLPTKKVERVFVYEAFVLVVSACFLGIIIGTLVGWSMVVQRALFTQLPIPFTFPVVEVCVVFATSLVLAMLSAKGPARRMNMKGIVEIMRMVS